MRWLLWDFDGTLGYHDGRWSRTLQQALAAEGLDFPLERIHGWTATSFPWHSPELSHAEFFGGTPWWEHMQNHFAALLRAEGVTAAQASAVTAGLKRSYLQPDRWHLYDDTIPALMQARALGYRLAILSNHVPELPEIVRGLGIAGYFEQVLTSAILGWEKPNPQFFRAAQTLLGCRQDATMIGDNPQADGAGALAAGFRAILVRGVGKLPGVPTVATLMEIFPHLKQSGG